MEFSKSNVGERDGARSAKAKPTKLYWIPLCRLRGDRRSENDLQRRRHTQFVIALDVIFDISHCLVKLEP